MIKAIICDIQGVLLTSIGQTNNGLISFLKESKKDYGMLIIHSNMSDQAIDFLPELFEIVDKKYFYKSTGYSKPDPRALGYILRENNLNPQDVVFVDDSIENIDSAKTLGVKTFRYENEQDTAILKNLVYHESDL